VYVLCVGMCVGVCESCVLVLDTLISQIYFWNISLHVSDISSLHDGEFFTVHAAMVYVIRIC